MTATINGSCSGRLEVAANFPDVVRYVTWSSRSLFLRDSDTKLVKREYLSDNIYFFFFYGNRWKCHSLP